MEWQERDRGQMVGTVADVPALTTAHECRVHAVLVRHGTADDLAAFGMRHQGLRVRWTYLYPQLDGPACGVGPALQRWCATLADVSSCLIAYRIVGTLPRWTHAVEHTIVDLVVRALLQAQQAGARTIGCLVHGRATDVRIHIWNDVVGSFGPDWCAALCRTGQPVGMTVQSEAAWGMAIADCPDDADIVITIPYPNDAVARRAV